MTNKITKPAPKIIAQRGKLVRAAKTLADYTTTSFKNGVVNLTDLYSVDNSVNNVTFTIRFNNMGVAVSTNAQLHDPTAGDKSIVTNDKGSIMKKVVGPNKDILGRFLNIQSVIVATSQTTVPTDLKVDFIIEGGRQTITYPLAKATFQNQGDQIALVISIFFF